MLCAALLPVRARAQATTSGATARATAAPPLREVTVAFIDVPLPEALERLATLGQISLLWDAAVVSAVSPSPSASSVVGTARISCRLERVPPERVLGCITREAGLDYYRLSSGTYVVIARPEDAPGYGSLVGIVVDSATGGAVPSARVRVATVDGARVAGDDGVFAFDRLLPGRHDVIVQAIGFRPMRRTLEVARDGAVTHRFALARVALTPAPVIINGITPGVASAALAGAALPESAAQPLVQPPSLFLPGAIATLGMSRRDGVGDLHLQGGEVGEHQWRLDGVPLFDAAALSGLVGAVPASAIDQVTVRRAGFRAAAGSLTAGAIDLTHALGEGGASRRPSFLVQGDPLALSARGSTPFVIGGARGQAMVAARQSTWQWTAPGALTRAIRDWNTPDPVLLHRLTGFAARPGMGDLDAAQFSPTGGDDEVAIRDLHAATRIELPGFQRLEGSIFSSAHALDRRGLAADTALRSLETTEAYDWATTGGQLTHRVLLGRRVLQRVQLRAVAHGLRHHSAMAMAGEGNAAMAGGERNRVQEVALAAEWLVTGADRWELTAGLEAAQARATLALSNAVLRPIDVTRQVLRGTAFLDATWRLGARTWLESGLRVTQLETGRTYAEPRLALRAEGETAAGRGWAWRIGGGSYHQFVNQFDVATTSPIGLVPSLRFWLPADGARGVPLAWHLAAEAVVRPWPGWELRGEGYGKWQPTILAFDYGALFATGDTSAGPLTSADAFVRDARGDAVGAGVRVVYDAAALALPLRLEAGYDAGRSRRTFPSRFGGSRQPAPWVEPHRALVSAELRPGAGVVLAARGRGVWGRRWALRQAFYDLFGATPAGAGLPIEAPGEMRRPAILDLDVGLTWERRLGAAQVALGASMLNALDRRNVLDFGLRRAGGTGNAGAAYTMVPRFLPGRQPVLTLRLTP
jgi:hypothetical protein